MNWLIQFRLKLIDITNISLRFEITFGHIISFILDSMLDLYTRSYTELCV